MRTFKTIPAGPLALLLGVLLCAHADACRRSRVRHRCVASCQSRYADFSPYGGITRCLPGYYPANCVGGVWKPATFPCTASIQSQFFDTPCTRVAELYACDYQPCCDRDLILPMVCRHHVWRVACP